MDQHNYSEHSKTSVKVHHEPGGGSSWSIGGGYGHQEQPQSYKQNYYQGNQEADQYGYGGYSMPQNNYNTQASGSSGNRKSQSYNKYSSFGNEIQNRIKAP